MLLPGRIPVYYEEREGLRFAWCDQGSAFGGSRMRAIRVFPTHALVAPFTMTVRDERGRDPAVGAALQYAIALGAVAVPVTSAPIAADVWRVGWVSIGLVIDIPVRHGEIRGTAREVAEHMDALAAVDRAQMRESGMRVVV